MKIVWRTIPDFPEYEINRLGEVRRKSTGRVLKPFDDRRGYLRVTSYLIRLGLLSLRAMRLNTGA